MEIVVDCCDSMGWYCYLEDKITFPFVGKCVVESRHRHNFLKNGESMTVVNLADGEECEDEIYDEVQENGDEILILLA